MPMACPQSHEPFTAAHAKACRPDRPAIRFTLLRPDRAVATRNAVKDRTSNRLLLCPFMILGLCYAFVLLGTSLPPLWHGNGTATNGRMAFVVFAGCQALAVLLLSPLVGIGEKRGFVYGAIVGLGTGLIVGLATAAGLLSDMVEPFALPGVRPAASRRIVLWLIPGLHMLCGAIGGALAGRIWRPAPPLPLARTSDDTPPPDSRLAQALKSHKRRRLPWKGPIGWPRVGMGVLLAVIGASSAGFLIQCVTDAGEGYVKVVGDSQHRVVICEFFSLAILLGGCLAGAGTSNGLKQGLCVGVIAGMTLLGLIFAGILAPSQAPPAPLVWIVILATVGGWFGTELLPPLHGARLRRR